MAEVFLNSIGAVQGAGLLESPKNGIPQPVVEKLAVFGEKVTVSPGVTLENAWILIVGQYISDVFQGGEGDIPNGYKIWKDKKHHIYPGFIEPFLEVKVNDQDVSRSGAHWNPRVQPSRLALEGDLPDSGSRSALRKAGFTVAQVVPSNGLIRGSTGVISLADIPSDRSLARPNILRSQPFQVLAFESGQSPNSLMGQISLIRQTFLDAEFNARSGSGQSPNVLDALRIERSHPANSFVDPTRFIFRVVDEVDLLRAEKILNEFGISRGLLFANGSEFKRMDALTRKYPLIVPLKFPKAPSLGSVGEQESVNLRDLMHWEHAPKNVLYLSRNNVPFILTSHGGVGEFLASARKVLKTGVSEDTLLESLTVVPAAQLGIDKEVGRLEKGMRANFIMTNKPVFEDGASIESTWVDGIPYKYSKEKKPSLKGLWNLTGFDMLPPRDEDSEPKPQDVRLKIESEKKAWLQIGEEKDEVSHLVINHESLHFITRHPALGEEPLVIISGSIFKDESSGEYELAGRLTKVDGSGSDWSATLIEEEPPVVVAEKSSPDDGNSGVESKSPGKNMIWNNEWVGSVYSDSGEEKDFTAFFKINDGVYRGHFEGDGRIFPAENIKVNEYSLTASVDTARKYIHVYFRHEDGDTLNGWASRLGNDPEKSQTKLRATRISKSLISDHPLAGKWQTATSDDDLGSATQPILNLELVEGEWRARLHNDGTVVDVPYLWSTGPEPSKDGIHFVFTEPSEEDESKNAPAHIELRYDPEFKKTSGTIIIDGEGYEKVSLDPIHPLLSAPLAETESSESKVKDGAPESGDKTASAQSGDDPVISPFALPFGPYSRDQVPEEEDVWVQNATIWTSGPQGNIVGGDLLVSKGKVVFVGHHDDAIEFIKSHGITWREINAAGMHVTPGLIDCHSHTGISRGINEMGQAVTAEVNIGTSTNPDDINWYRQLAGGLTTVNTLHGSANPIGGQNQVNKLRWGVKHPDEMHFEGAMPGIKFALGENVKRNQSRYPNTRMGVESVFRERFQAAREYFALHNSFRNGDIGVAPRRDLELEALGEILDGRRLIHCHSYRQDEILMLCRVAGEFGFRIGTFQHILEGYKVAEVIREHAIGGSAFSDWWAYKVEVQDAIPFAGAIMHNAGMVVSFNSDDSEMARRMNLEAAKAVKYGGLSEMEALKFVTLNPAKQLMIEDRVGSLEVGKDADFVIWDKHPFSTATVCQSTWIDGREFFSIQNDKELRELITKERKRLISKIIGPGKKANKSDEKENEPEKPDAVATAGGSFKSPQDFWKAKVLQQKNLELLQMGIDPSQSQCGECGLRVGSIIQ